MTQHWEYRVLFMPLEPLFKQDVAPGTQDRLNEYGERGWELVSMSPSASPNTSSMIAVFTRPKAS